MRIAVIVFGLPPTRIGGTEIGTQEISRYLARSHEVHVYTLGLPGEKPEEERYGFHIHRLKTRWIYQLPGVEALYYFSLLRSLKSLRPDIIQIMGLKNRGSYGSLIARFLDIPYVIWDRGSMNELSHLYQRTLGYFVLRNAHAVIAQTPDMKKKMKAIIDRNVYVLPNGVDLDAYAIDNNGADNHMADDGGYDKDTEGYMIDAGCKDSDAFDNTIDDNDVNGHMTVDGGYDNDGKGHEQSLRADINGVPEIAGSVVRIKYNLEDKKIVAFLGRMDPVKCVPDIIDSIDLARKSIPDIHLLMIGKGPQWEEIADYIRKKDLNLFCTMVGSVAHEKVPEYLLASDVQVLVSSREGYPISVIEGMAAGLPQIVSDVSGLPDIVKDGINGFVVPVHSPEIIAKKLGILFSNNELKWNMSRENRSKAKAHSWDSIIEQLEKIYYDLLNTNK